MKLTPQQEEEFRQIYKRYNQELRALTATRLANLHKSLTHHIGDKVSLWAASQFLRVENHIAPLYDLTVASELPSPGESPGKPEGP